LDVALDGLPLVCDSLGYGGVLSTCFLLDLFDKLGHQFIDTFVAVVTCEDIKHRACLNLSVAILLQSLLRVVLKLDDKGFTLSVELFFEFLAEDLHFVVDVAVEFKLQIGNLFVDQLNSAKEAVSGLLESLLQSHLNIKKITFECGNEALQLLLVGGVVSDAS